MGGVRIPVSTQSYSVTLPFELGRQDVLHFLWERAHCGCRLLHKMRQASGGVGDIHHGQSRERTGNTGRHEKQPTGEPCPNLTGDAVGYRNNAPERRDNRTLLVRGP